VYEQLRGMLIGTADCCMAKNLKHMIVRLHGEKRGYLFLHEIKMLGNVATFDGFWQYISLSLINVLDITVALELLQQTFYELGMFSECCDVGNMRWRTVSETLVWNLYLQAF
jgi:hypothetical protein